MTPQKIIATSIRAIGTFVPLVLWSICLNEGTLFQSLTRKINGDYITNIIFYYFLPFGIISWILFFVEYIQGRYNFSGATKWIKIICLLWILFYVIRIVIQVFIYPKNNPSADEFENVFTNFLLVTWDHAFLAFYISPFALMLKKKNSILNEILLIYSSTIISFLFLHHYFSYK